MSESLFLYLDGLRSISLTILHQFALWFDF